MPLKTKRWNDPVEPDDGHRLLITRYRPRGVSKADETWAEWNPRLGPDKTLHWPPCKTETSSKIPWPQYTPQSTIEQQKRNNQELIAALARRINAGETITLLCSSACTRESRCHRSILRELIEAEMEQSLQ